MLPYPLFNEEIFIKLVNAIHFELATVSLISMLSNSHHKDRHIGTTNLSNRSVHLRLSSHVTSSAFIYSLSLFYSFACLFPSRARSYLPRLSTVMTVFISKLWLQGTDSFNLPPSKGKFLTRF